MTGSKGLGRLSVQFLADEMTLESTSADEPSRYLYALVDWTGIQHGEGIDTFDVLWPWNQVSGITRATGIPAPESF